MKRRSIRMWSGLAVMAALIAGLLAGSAAAQTPPAAPVPKTSSGDKPRPSEAATPVNENVAACLGCHEDKDLSLALKDGSSMSLYVDAQQFARSVHGTQLVCTDCHAKYDQNHPSGATFPSRRSYAIAAYETCKKCHFDSYTRTLESVHYELLKAGMEAAPVCTDCHGSHNIQNPHEKRAMVSRSCATCHEDIYKKYAASVHGKALVEGGNRDVPACADCHTHHQIQQPGTTQFRLNSPELCIRCHGDAQLMARYGISARVAQTYLADFHGVTASLGRAAPAAQQRVVVTCVDCHGVHEIASPRARGEAAMKASVAASCQKCHKGASPDFPAAWLSHYEPSLRHAPLVFFIDLFYKFFIPFVVIGLVLHVLMHLYRVSLGR
jgi:predicted CXXCH cytochrome family protein